MRKHYFLWMVAVFGIIGVAYGGYSLIYSVNHGEDAPLLGIFLLIFGFVALIVFLGVYIPASIISRKKGKKENEKPVVEEKKIEEPTKIEVKPVESKKPANPQRIEREYTPRSSTSYSAPSRSYSSTVYVKKVGYGPILRVEGNRILDMRNSTYYRFEGDMLMQEGYGPVFEIRGNQIKNAFGGYLYEISGSNINKVFGGFYASISGNYITLYDLSIKYEMTDSLSKNQLLAVAVLLFGKY